MHGVYVYTSQISIADLLDKAEDSEEVGSVLIADNNMNMM